MFSNVRKKIILFTFHAFLHREIKYEIQNGNLLLFFFIHKTAMNLYIF